MSETPKLLALMAKSRDLNALDYSKQLEVLVRELERENAKLRKNFMFAESEIILLREDRDEFREKIASLREMLINADELERYTGSDGRRQWGKCSTWLHSDDAVIIVSAKALDAIRKEI